MENANVVFTETGLCARLPEMAMKFRLFLSTMVFAYVCGLTAGGQTHFEFFARTPNKFGLDRRPFRGMALFLSRLSGLWFQPLPTNPSSAAAITIFHARHRRGTFLFLVVALWLSPLFGVAQVVTETGQITGDVKDPARAAVVGANVVLKDLQGAVKATTVSDGEGVYTFPSVQPGLYVVEVDANGFKHAVSTNLEVAASQIVRFDCNFVLAEVSENVTVSGRQRRKRLSRGNRECGRTARNDPNRQPSVHG